MVGGEVYVSCDWDLGELVGKREEIVKGGGSVEGEDGGAEFGVDVGKRWM